MIWAFFIIAMGIVSRLAGNGFGSKWGLSWLPELVFAVPFGIAAGWACNEMGGAFLYSLLITAAGTGISYAGMQSATWMFLRWESHEDPNRDRSSTMKPFIDWLAGRFGYELGDEGYSWIAAGVKGFIIGLPVGAVLNTALWPAGYEIGSHAKGRVERFRLDPHAVSEFMAGIGGGVSVWTFVQIIKTTTG